MSMILSPDLTSKLGYELAQLIDFLEANSQSLDSTGILAKPSNDDEVPLETFGHLDGKVYHLSLEEEVTWPVFKQQRIQTAMGVFKNPFDHQFDFGSAKSWGWREEVRQIGKVKGKYKPWFANLVTMV